MVGPREWPDPDWPEDYEAWLDARTSEEDAIYDRERDRRMLEADDEGGATDARGVCGDDPER